MAFQLGGGGDEVAETHDINVTPFIDVMLVLLIIFMVAAPLATVDVKVDLPASTALPQPRSDKPVFVTLTADRKLMLDQAAMEPAAIGPALDTMTGRDHDQRIFLRADTTVPYGALMDVLNTMRAAGYLKVALVGLDASQAGPVR